MWIHTVTSMQLIHTVDTYSYNLVFLKTKKFKKFSGFP